MSDERMMRAGRAHGRGHADLVEETIPVPHVGDGEVLVAVHASAVTTGELNWPDDVPFIPGHDVSGTIAELGTGVTNFNVGDEVIGLIGFDRPGAAADYTLVPASDVAAKPSSIDHVHAATVPLAALTAWQALHDHYRLQKGEHVLVHGGAGGVGSYVVQLAVRHGARVTATASANSAEYVRSLGAETVIDYTSRFEEQVSDVDLVVDTVGGETLSRSWGVLRSGGTMICVADEPPPEEADAHDAHAVFFIVEPNGEQLSELSRLVNRGALRTAVKRVLPLAELAEAFAPPLGPYPPGKIVIQVRGEG
jgi:NADPH:quinone reductase-like Zn-dependent oxidoreductase